MEKVGELAEELGAAEPLFAEEDERRDQLFEYRRQVGEAVIETTTFRDVDISFPRSKLFEVVTGVKKIGQRHGFRSVIFGHCGDGNVHVQVLRNDLDDAAWQGPVRDGIRAIYQLATALGGALSGEHGIGCTLLPYLDLMYDEVVLDLMRGIKRTFDPKGILNPGKVVVDKAR
jgi:glycolate oxidase